MKQIVVVILVMVSAFGWEINTHRAIERVAIEQSANFKYFLEHSGIKNEKYKNEIFEGYGMSYRDYLIGGEENGISADKWNQNFSGNMYATELIEAGAILEDAQWPHSPGTPNVIDMADGRFVNHFYDPQNGGEGLHYRGLKFQSAREWVVNGEGKLPQIIGPVQLGYPLSDNDNDYDFHLAYEYFKLAFTSKYPADRRRYQAKFFVTLGHVMHILNDMTSPAHTRDDAHAEGDPMEVWGRGGVNGSDKIGFRIAGNSLYDSEHILKKGIPNIPKYTSIDDFVAKEAKWTSTHFFSKDTIFTKPYPSRAQTYEELVQRTDDMEKYYIRSYRRDDVPQGTRLAIRLRSYIINALHERYYTDEKKWMGFDESTAFRGDYAVAEDTTALLIPRAIANARNFLDFMFRTRLSVEIFHDRIVITNTAVERVPSGGGGSLSNTYVTRKTPYAPSLHGKFYIKYDNGDGVLHDFAFKLNSEKVYDSNIGFIGDPEQITFSPYFHTQKPIAPGQKSVIYINGKESTDLWNKTIYVFYEDDMGDGLNFGACRVTSHPVIGSYSS